MISIEFNYGNCGYFIVDRLDNFDPYYVSIQIKISVISMKLWFDFYLFWYDVVEWKNFNMVLY